MSAAENIGGQAPASSDAGLASRPVVFVGLGGAGAHVLRRLRRRFAERLGEAVSHPLSSPDLWCESPVGHDEAGGTPAPQIHAGGTRAPQIRAGGTRAPQIRFLALDTDITALRSPDDRGGSFTSEETLHLPLRKPAEYRSASDDILSWLSRRWLYNIPRSLRTEGLRPLGRLAFVDHRLAIAERLRRVLAGLSPRIFIVASIDGGAGGGMLLDVAYAVRQQLDELRLSSDCLCGLLLHGTFDQGAANELRRANAYATLTELNHFMRGIAAYHTGPVEVLPAGDVSEPPFHDAYLLDLGEELDEAEFGEALDQVAEYLFVNATSCTAALDDARRAARMPHAKAGGPVHLRSFALHAVQLDKPAIAASEADQLCLRLVRQWLGEDANGSPSAALIQPPDFTLDDLTGRVQAIAEKALGGSAETHFRSLVTVNTTLTAGGTDDLAGPLADPLRRIHAVFGLPAAADAAPPGQYTPLETAVREGSRKPAAAMGDVMIKSIEDLVEQPRGRLPAAWAGASMLQEHVRNLRQAAVENLRREQAQVTLLWSRLKRGELPGRRGWFRSATAVNDDAERLLLAYCRSRLRELIHQSVAYWLQEVATSIAALNERLTGLRQVLRGLSAEFAAAVGEHDARDDASRVAFRSAKGRTFAERKTTFAASMPELRRFAEHDYLLEFESTHVCSLLAARGGLMGLADKDPDHNNDVSRQLHAVACDAVLEALIEVDAASVLLAQHVTGPALATWIDQTLAKTVPRLANGADGGRLFAILPSSSNGEQIATAIRERAANAMFAPSTRGEIVLLREVDGIVLSDVAAALIANSGDCAAAARRVLTRTDVCWTTLPATQAAGQ